MPRFTLKQLRYAEAADRLGSIAAAAGELNISQSSIAAAIDALEAELGYDAFMRMPAKGIRATAPGREALALIRRFMHQARQFEEALDSLGGKARGTVRIACYATAAPSFLPLALRALAESFPDASVRVLEGDMARVAGFLDSGEADLAFTYSDSVDSRHDFVALFEAPPYAMVALDDPLAKRASATLEALASRPMAMLDLPLTRDYFLSMFEARGLAPAIAHSARSSEIARALVAGGFGFSILNIRPADYGEGESRYRILPILDAPAGPVFGAATAAGAIQPRVVRSFIRSCVEMKEKGEFESLVVRPPGRKPR